MSSRASGGRLLSLMLLVAIAVFGTAGIAEATVITYWKGIQPTGSVGTNLPVTISGSGVYSLSPLAPSTAKLSIDAVALPRAAFTASIGRSSVYFYYVVQPPLTDGPHTFRAEVSDGQGRLSYREWTANIVEPPRVAWVSPAAGSSDRSGRPTIVMTLADNTPGTTFTVAGQVHAGGPAGPVAATFGGTALPAGQASFTLPSELPPGVYYLTATVTDAAGNARILAGVAAREFASVPAEAMTILSGCDDCHAEYRAAHQTRATTDCMVCHPGYNGDHMEGTEYCEDCHTAGWHNDGAKSEVRVISACTNCHGTERPEVKQHTAASVEGSHAGSCGGCHDTSLITKHAYTPEGSAYASQCDLCHASTDPAVAAAIATGDATCDACHDGQHAGMEAAHASTSASDECTRCHDTSLSNIHGADTDPAKCATCHNETMSLAGKSGDCGDCHLTSGPGTPPDAYHRNMDASHTYAGMPDSCLASGCHINALVATHDPYVGAGNKYPQYPDACALCHLNDDPARVPANATAACTSCHAGPHAEVHASTGGSDWISNGLDDNVVHQLSDGANRSCSDCHATAGLYDVHSGDCTLCHVSTARQNVKDAVANHQTGCVSCHPSQHQGPIAAHKSYYDSSYYNCGDCHSTGCTRCHSAPDRIPPVTTSNAVSGSSYTGSQTFTLSPSDTGGSGVAATYWRLESQGAAWTSGKVVAVPAPHTGTRTETLYWYSRDNAGNTETTKSVTFTITALVDTTAPVTTSSATEGGIYTSAQTFVLNAVDPGGSGVAGTWWRLDEGEWTAGTSIPVPMPSSGTVSHTIYFYSRDYQDNTEATKSVSFSMAQTVTQTTTLGLTSSPSLDADYTASGPWGTYKVYLDGTLLGTKAANSTATWSCPEVTLSPTVTHRIDVVADVGFTVTSDTYASDRPKTFSLTLPLGSTKLNAASWSGFANVVSGTGYSDVYYDLYGNDEYVFVRLPTSTLTGISYTRTTP